MLSQFTTLVLATSAILSGVSAQYYPPYVANDTDINLRTYWCVQQQASCDLLCLDQKSGSNYVNGCDPQTLNYSCECDDGSNPNATQYSQTIPYFICQAQVASCSNNCGGVSTCIAACTDNKPCGASNPTRVNTSTITTHASTRTSTGTATAINSDEIIYTGLGTGVVATETAAKTSGADQAVETGTGLGLKSNAITFAFGEVFGVALMMMSLLCSTFFFLM